MDLRVKNTLKNKYYHTLKHHLKTYLFCGRNRALQNFKIYFLL
jgi:hypothetical protein